MAHDGQDQDGPGPRISRAWTLHSAMPSIHTGRPSASLM